MLDARLQSPLLHRCTDGVPDILAVLFSLSPSHNSVTSETRQAHEFRNYEFRLWTIFSLLSPRFLVRLPTNKYSAETHFSFSSVVASSSSSLALPILRVPFRCSPLPLFVLSIAVIYRRAECPFSDLRITSRAQRTEQTRRRRTCCTLYSPSLMRRINTTYRLLLHRRVHRHCRRNSCDFAHENESDRSSLDELIG